MVAHQTVEEVALIPVKLDADANVIGRVVVLATSNAQLVV